MALVTIQPTSRFKPTWNLRNMILKATQNVQGQRLKWITRKHNSWLTVINVNWGSYFLESSNGILKRFIICCKLKIQFNNRHFSRCFNSSLAGQTNVLKAPSKVTKMFAPHVQKGTWCNTSTYNCGMVVLVNEGFGYMKHLSGYSKIHSKVVTNKIEQWHDLSFTRQQWC